MKDIEDLKSAIGNGSKLLGGIPARITNIKILKVEAQESCLHKSDGSLGRNMEIIIDSKMISSLQCCFK